MRTHSRSTHQRDRRFARVRRLTQSVLIGSGLASGLFVGYAASIAKPLTTIPKAPLTTTGATGGSSPAPTTAGSSAATTPPATAGASSGTSAATAPATTYTPPTTAPVTTTTTCYTTPSGTTVCY